jgi:hypothetical protein
VPAPPVAGREDDSFAYRDQALAGEGAFEGPDNPPVGRGDGFGYDDGFAGRVDPGFSQPPVFEVPWWISTGEAIDATALSNRKKLRERDRSHGLAAGYDTFWGFVDNEPASVLPMVESAVAALHRRDVALARRTTPWPPGLMAGVLVMAAVAFGVAGGPAGRRAATAATTCLVLAVAFIWAALNFPFPPRLAAIVAVACLAASAVPAIHVTLWYDVLVGLAFAGAGVAITGLQPIARRWRIERNHWNRPDVAMVGALLEFADSVESDPLPPARRLAVAALDRAATRFELEWQRVNRTGVDITDRALRAWAGRIHAETRELLRVFAFGPPSTEALLLGIYELVQAIVNRYSLNDHEDAWVRNGSWRKPPTTTLARFWVRSKASARYVRQCLLAGFIGAAALSLLADTVWSAVHTFIGTHVSRHLGSALNFDPTVQLFVAGLGVSLFAVAGRAFNRRHQ